MIYPPEQPFSLPSNTLMLNVANVVPAPRLELISDNLIEICQEKPSQPHGFKENKSRATSENSVPPWIL